MTVVLGEMDVARVNPYRFGRDQRPAQLAWSQPRAPVNGGHQSVGESRSVSHPVDDVYQSRMTNGVGGWEMTFGEDKKRNRQPKFKSNFALGSQNCHRTSVSSFSS